MDALSADLSLGAQTSYAELYGMAQSLESARFVVLRGSFHLRQIKNKPYVYFNFRDTGGRVRSVYVGPGSERVQRLVDEYKQASGSDRLEALARRAQACIALGCSSLPTKHVRMIQKLGGYGLFHGGAVLAGTSAFVALGNMLGQRWINGVDTVGAPAAHAAPSISVILPAGFELPRHDALSSLEAGFLPGRDLAGQTTGPLSHSDVSELRVQLTALRLSRDESAPPPLSGVELRPAEFADLLLENATHGVVFSKSCACMVNLPDPAHFAVHNLAIFGATSRLKCAESFKYLMQAAALIEWHLDQQRVAHLREVWRGALARGAVWRTSAEKGRDELLKQHAALAHGLE